MNPETVSYLEKLDTNRIRQILCTKSLNEKLSGSKDLLGVRQPFRANVIRTHFSSKRPPVFQVRIEEQESNKANIFLAELIGRESFTHFQSEQIRLAKAKRNQIGKQDKSSLVDLPGLGLVMRKPGLDAKLPGLELLNNDTLLKELCGRALGSKTDHISPVAKLISHRLGKRAVLRVDFLDRKRKPLYIKLRSTHSSSGRDAFDKHKMLEECFALVPNVDVPKAIFFDSELGAAVYFELSGTRLLFQDCHSYENASLIFSALESFGKIAPKLATTHSSSDELSIAKTWSERLARIYPDLSPILDKATSSLWKALNTTSISRACHRDFHEGQLIRTKSGIGILDFDTICWSHRALDAGNIIAHLSLLRVLYKVKTEKISDLLRYRLQQEFAEEELRAWTAVALVRLAGIYGLSSGGVAYSRALLKELRL